MWNRSSSKTPVIGFGIPPSPRKLTEKALETFSRVGNEHAALQRELRELRQARPARIAEARQQAAEAVLAGKLAKSGEAQVAAEIDAALAAGATRLDAVSVAADLAGNALAEAVVADRDDWIADLEQVEDAARNRAIVALAELSDALHELGPAQSGPAWLRRFDLGQAFTGSQTQFSGGRVDVDSRSVRRESNLPVAQLLAPLARLLKAEADADNDDSSA